jgi:hypothetical protein
VFKYSNTYFSRGLAELGLFRIGTLYDFRSVEHNSGISDPDEGTKIVKVQIDNETYESGGDVPKALAALGLIKCDDTCSNITINNIHTTHNILSPDFYIWCASTERSTSVMSQFEGANTCVEVFDVSRFLAIFNQLMTTMNAEFVGVFEVQYRERTEDWNRENLGIHPALLKDVRFRGQKELRAIWKPNHGNSIEPIQGRCDGLSSCCRVVPV